MDAIKLLKDQHREVAALFDTFEESIDDDDKKETFFAIADALAIHASIEERFFYPAVNAGDAEELVEEAYDEHLEIKKLILDGMKLLHDPGFDAVVAALRGAVELHVEEEEDELFPRARDMLDREVMNALGETMEAEAVLLESEGPPRDRVRLESEQPAV